MIIWYHNGFVIQDANKISIHIPNQSSYCGIGLNESWPLENFDTYPEIHTLNNTLHDRWFNYHIEYNNETRYPLKAVPDLGAVRKYVNICNELGIVTRVLYCQSEFDFPEVEVEIISWVMKKVKLLGYEFVTSHDFYPAIYDDLYGLIPEELCGFKELLNEYGIFSKENDLITYIEKRSMAIKFHPGELEHQDILLRAKIYEISAKEIENSNVVPVPENQNGGK